MKQLNAIATIAYRDLTKLFRDKTRMLASLIFPLVFIGVLGGSFQSNLSEDVGYNFLVFMFTGVIGQVMFQSTAAGIISLIEDRQNDFSQEIFVSPVSRYTIIIGKIIGELMVSSVQLITVILLSVFVIGVPLNLTQFITLIPAIFVGGLLGGAFGLLVLSNLSSERSANQIFPFLIFPQYFLGGVFSPIKNLPLVLDILSKITPMRYVVDLVRGLYYSGTPTYEKVVLLSPGVNLLVISIMFVIFLVSGTFLFVRNEKNR